MTSWREKCTCSQNEGVKRGQDMREKKGKIHRFLNKRVNKVKLKLDYKAMMLCN